jgi:hypothetical protein
MVVLATVSVASADLLVLRDMTPDTDLSPRDGVTPMGRDATGSFFQGINGGYNVIDADIMHDGEFLDMTDDTVEIQLSASVNDGSEWVGYWVRFYTGTWNGTEYEYGGWANAFFEVTNDGAWHTYTKAVADFDEPFADPTLYESIYKYRVDAVHWTASEDNPVMVGIGSIPEPASLSLLVLGGLAVLHRRR